MASIKRDDRVKPLHPAFGEETVFTRVRARESVLMARRRGVAIVLET